MMMQPMKPAPICSTRAPGWASCMIARASASVQQVCTPGPSMPGIGGVAGRRAGGDEQAVERQRAAVVQRNACARRCRRLGARPRRSVDAQALRSARRRVAQVRAFLADVAHQQVGNRHARVRRLGLVADDHDRRRSGRACGSFRRRSRRPGRRPGSRASWCRILPNESKAVREPPCRSQGSGAGVTGRGVRASRP